MFTLWKILTRKKSISEGEGTSSLARVLNTFDLTALGVGSTLGVGLYVLVGKVAKETAGPSVVLSFLIAAVASAFAGLCYAEFGARTPRAGSAYVYSYVCVGEFIAFVIGWNLILEYVIGSASVARGISLYINALTNDTITNTFIDIAPIGISFLSPYFDFLSFSIAIVLSAGLAFGLKESSKANNIFTVLNILVVLFVVIAGSTKADINNWDLKPPANTTDAGSGGFFPFGVTGMIKGAATCFYGFVGFDCIATTGEEAINPQKAIPLAIVLSLLIVFLAYFSTATVVTLMVPYYLQDVDSPIPHAFDEFGWNIAKWIVTIGGIFALMASLFGAMFPLPRIIYAMANDGLIFRFLGKVSSTFSTPVIGTLLAGLLTGLMAAIFEQGQLVDMMSIGTLLAYTIVAACVLLLRYSVDDQSHALVRSDSDTSVNDYSVNTDLSDEEKDNLVNDDVNNDDLTCCGYTKQIFNIKKLSQPTVLSERLVTFEICFFCLLCLLLSFCAKYLVHDISQGEPYAIAIPSVIGFLMIITLMSISTQPNSNKVLHFKVPFVPLVPALSILVNIYLMMALDVTTWIRFGVWMAVGLPIYLFSAHCASKDAHNACNSRIKTHKRVSNGNTYTNAGYVDDEKIDTANNSDSAFYEGNESGDDKVVEECEKGRFCKDKFDRKMSVDTVSNTSNTVLHENVVALVHQEDSLIIEEEEEEVVSKDKNALNSKNAGLRNQSVVGSNDQEEKNGIILIDEEDFISKIKDDVILINNKITESKDEIIDDEKRSIQVPEIKIQSDECEEDKQFSIPEADYEEDLLNVIDDINKIIEVEEGKLKGQGYSEAFNKNLPDDMPEAVKAAVHELEMVIEIEEGKLEPSSRSSQNSINRDFEEKHDENVTEYIVPAPPPLPPPQFNKSPYSTQTNSKSSDDNKLKNGGTKTPINSKSLGIVDDAKSNGIKSSPSLINSRSPGTVDETKSKNGQLSPSFIRKFDKEAPVFLRRKKNQAPLPPANDTNEDVEILKIGSEEHKKFSSKLQSLLTPSGLSNKHSPEPIFKFEVPKTPPSALNRNAEINLRDESSKDSRSGSFSSIDENAQVGLEGIKEMLNDLFKSRSFNSEKSRFGEVDVGEKLPKRRLSQTFPRNKDQLMHKERMQQTLNNIKLRMLETNKQPD